MGLAKELVDLRVGEGLSTRLGVAAGTGWNATKLINGGFDYWALDLSETATAVAMRRHPEAKFINASIDEAGVIRDGAFDVVFCASMLEHLKDPKRALRHLMRIARRHLFVIFFEGLADAGQDQIAQYPFTNPDYLVFGTKFTNLQKEWGGYFWNRYTRQTIERVLSRNWTDVNRILGCEQSFLHQRGGDPSRQEIEVFSAAHQPARHRG